MIAAAAACARLTALEILRARLVWAFAAYVAAVAALPLATSSAAPQARAGAMVAILHSLTVLFGAALAVAASTQWIPRDLRTRVLHGILSKPVTGAGYFLGRLAGVWLFLTAAAVVFFVAGAALLAWVDASVALLPTDESVGALRSFERTRESAVARWDLAAPRGALFCRLESPSNPFWRPRLRVAFRALPGGEDIVREETWTGGRMILHLAVPPGALREGMTGLALDLRTVDGSRLDRLLAADARPLLVTRERRIAALWGMNVASLWAEMLVVSVLGLALSTFCSFPVAALACGALYLAANALPFLRELPRMIDPEVLPQLFSPTLYHSHAHAGEAHGEGPEGAAYRWARRAASGAVDAFTAVCPDLGRMADGRRMEEGLLLGWGEWGRRTLGLLPHLVVAAALAAAWLSRREHP